MVIPGGQISSKRQTVFFLPVDPGDKSHKDLDEIDLNVPRHAQYLHNAWKRHQDAVYWVDIDLSIQKGLTFYQTRSNAIILQDTLPANCIPKVVRMKTMFIILGHWHRPLHVRALLAKRKRGIRNSSSTRWTFFQFRSTSSRKDDLTDINMVKSRETRNTIRPTS